MKGQHQTDAVVPWSECARLRAIRRARGWTQLNLSIRLGISERTVNAIERGVCRGRRVYTHEALRTFFRSCGD